jgi:N-acetylglucosaminyldiphosphoundecaprenol N-acetyl-beta-D-mannosaminyltransferase
MSQVIMQPPTLSLPPRFPVAGVLVSRTDYAEAAATIIRAAQARVPLVAAATSVHGVAKAALERDFRAVLNDFDLITPDGQPVRWALNLLHGAALAERVYGPTLMLRVCERAAASNLGVYFYGGRNEVLDQLVRRLQARVPQLSIAGAYAPPFRPLTTNEQELEATRIRASGAAIVFVGLGCPKQEWWAHNQRARLGLPLVCVGAAFDFHAGTLRQAPAWMQARGLEWLFRVYMEPRRLWRRYAKHIPIFVAFVSTQYVAERLARLVRRAGMPPKEV